MIILFDAARLSPVSLQTIPSAESQRRHGYRSPCAATDHPTGGRGVSARTRASHQPRALPTAAAPRPQRRGA